MNISFSVLAVFALLMPVTLLAQPIDDSEISDSSIIWPDGTRYVGGIIGEERSGEGVIYWQDGSRFEGDFENDMRNGQGTLILPNGMRYSGIFEDDVLVSVVNNPEIEGAAENEEQYELAQTTELDGAITELNDEVKQEVMAFVDLWAKNWSGQAVDEYLGSYSQQFQAPGDQTYEGWQESRTMRLSRPSFIDLGLEYAGIEIVSANTIDVYFNQTYTSDNYSDVSNKQLRIQKEGEDWRIIAELSYADSDFVTKIENAQPLRNVEIIEPQVEIQVALESDDILGLDWDGIKQELVTTIESWAAAWSEQETSDYLEFYAEDFQLPGGLTRDNWESVRAERLSKPAYINLDITYSSFEMNSFDTVDVRFEQTFSSDSFSDLTDKVLRLRREAGSWKIVEEINRGSEVLASSSNSSAAAPSQNQVVPVLLSQDSALPLAIVSEETKQQIIGTIELWQSAWSNQEPAQYIEQYSSDFQLPSGLTRSAWEASREERLAAPNYIFLDILDARFEEHAPDMVDVFFRQVYDSNLYSDFTNKVLRFQKEGLDWKILVEQVAETELN